MYLISHSFLSPDGSCYYSSLAGAYAGLQTQTGMEPNCTILKGHLSAVLQGLKRIEYFYGLKDRYPLDVLIDDSKIARQMQNAIDKGVGPKDPDQDLWASIIARKSQFDFRFVTSPADSDHLRTIWCWSATPPETAQMNFTG